MSSPVTPPSRLQLTLHKPRLGWFPKPTVVVNGRGHPAQWGTGTWQIRAGEKTEIAVYLFNRLWKFGTARIPVEAGEQAVLIYSAPWLPFLPGSLKIEHGRDH
ncbi:hypothetical protein [Leifsonia sp. Root112D2]|uniref:hypothetical protein n=1 Tax=Leifsonia sp. Root112D2 TaxID=1736426 RepID=UPI0009E70687|nr:hypothetical protein [Leifsonia sp. Root112D2]